MRTGHRLGCLVLSCYCLWVFVAEESQIINWKQCSVLLNQSFKNT